MEISGPPAKRRKTTPRAGHRPATTASLARTQQDDSTLSAYTYRALKEEDEIRIFKVEKIGPNEWQYGIEHTTLADAPPFETVSYVWGPDTRRNILRLRDDRTIRINDNLAKALPYISAECKTGYLWIDQININQSSTQERNHQVKMMGGIYKKGERVIVWLGTGLNPSKAVIAFIETMCSLLELREDLVLTTAKVEHELLKLCPTDFWAILRLLDSEWFSRGWVFQEIVLSKHAAFLLGDIVVPLLALVWISRVCANSRIRANAHHCQMNSSGPSHVRTQPSFNLDEVSTRSYRTLSMMHHSWYTISRGVPTMNLSFMRKLSKVSPLLHTTDPKDSVYAFLGLQNISTSYPLDGVSAFEPTLSGGIEADYSSTYEECLTNTALSFIRDTNTLEILLHCKRKTESYPPKHLPSWVPEWRAAISAPLLVRKTHPGSVFYPSHDLVPTQDPNELHVRGACLDTISTCFAPEHRFRATTWYEENLEQYLALDKRRDSVQGYTVCSRERLLDVLLTRHYRPDINFKKFHGTSDDYSTMDLLKEYDEYRNTHDKTHRVKESKNLHALRYLTYSLNNRQLFLTKGGHLGHVEQPSEGDKICSLKGFGHLIVLRPCGENHFSVVGTCHVEDKLWDWSQYITWNGSAFDTMSFWEKHEATEFILV